MEEEESEVGLRVGVHEGRRSRQVALGRPVLVPSLEVCSRFPLRYLESLWMCGPHLADDRPLRWVRLVWRRAL